VTQLVEHLEFKPQYRQQQKQTKKSKIFWLENRLHSAWSTQRTLHTLHMCRSTIKQWKKLTVLTQAEERQGSSINFTLRRFQAKQNCKSYRGGHCIKAIIQVLLRILTLLCHTTEFEATMKQNW
jgi:hypothetical protein